MKGNAMRLPILSAVILFFAGAASAQNVLVLKSSRTPEESEAAFVVADVNKDDKLDTAEFKQALDPEILKQLPEGVATRLSHERDTDGDGFVSRAEFLAKGKVALHP